MRQKGDPTNNSIQYIKELLELQAEHTTFLERGLNPIFPAGALDFYEDLKIRILIKQIQLDFIKLEQQIDIFEAHLNEVLMYGQQS